MDEGDSLQFILLWSTIPFLVVGFIGNVLVIRIVYKTGDMHTPTNYLLANMAVSDVITILLWPFYFFEFTKFICKFFALIEICIVVSCITLTVLTVERYHAFSRQLRHGSQFIYWKNQGGGLSSEEFNQNIVRLQECNMPLNVITLTCTTYVN